jgi:maltose alpha-D-glucosyltransferase/alpha-amylase
VPGGWETILVAPGKERLENALIGYIKQRRWFAGKARKLKSITLTDAIDIRTTEGTAYLTTIVATYAEGDPETYMLPIAHAPAAEAAHVLERWPQAAITWIRSDGQEPRALLFDALGPPGLDESLLSAMARRRRFGGPNGTLVGSTTKAFARLRGPETIRLEAALSVAEQSNNSVVFGERLILKIFRRVEEGVNPELELGRFLTERTDFTQMAPLAGALEYRPDRGEAMSVAVLQGYVPNQGDAWKYTQSTLAAYFKVAEQHVNGDPPVLPRSLLLTSAGELPELATQTIGAYLDAARLLGKRTAELHLALASDPSDIVFAPERISAQDQRSVYQSISALSLRATELLRSQLNRLPEDTREEARQVLELEPQIAHALRSFLTRKLTTTRIRVHGDYHLGQVLYTGHDFVIIDFEGEPTRTLYERRLKRLAMRDVAGMLRSFHYASQAALRSDGLKAELLPRMQPWARLWVDSVSVAFMRGYLGTAGTASFAPQTPADLELQLTTMLLEKALYELRYELNSRPDWVRIPLLGIRDLVAPG